jgi:hypothetical protein
LYITVFEVGWSDRQGRDERHAIRTGPRATKTRLKTCISAAARDVESAAAASGVAFCDPPRPE